MAQEKTFNITLKNDSSIALKFTSIPATHDQLWQMFATTEALEVLEKLVAAAIPEVTSSARKVAPTKSQVTKNKK